MVVHGGRVQGADGPTPGLSVLNLEVMRLLPVQKSDPAANPPLAEAACCWASCGAVLLFGGFGESEEPSNTLHVLELGQQVVSKGALSPVAAPIRRPRAV